MSKRDRKWKRRTLGLPADHGWVARPGCKVLVIERGAVRLDYPQEWVARPDDDSMKLHDKPPPDDECRLAVSFIRIPLIDWSGLPISKLVDAAGEADTRGVHTRSEIVDERHGLIELAWREVRFDVESEKREACSLLCLARKGSVQALITFDFWTEQRDRCLRIWRTVLNSLELDVRYDSPFTGRPVR